MLLLTFSNELEVDHLQVYELESWDGFTAGVADVNDSFIFPGPLTWDLGELDLDGGEHSLWVERLDGTDTMWDVVNLHLEDDGGWVPYHRPDRPRTVERDGVEYELMFTFDITSPGNHTIESMGSDPDLRGEEVHIMVTQNTERDPTSLLPGLIVLLCGIALLVHAVLRREDAVQADA